MDGRAGQNPIGREGFPSAVPSDCLHAAVRGVLLREYGLTAQQLRALEMLSVGKDQREIADLLHCSPRRIQGIVSELHQLLGTGDRYQLVAIWLGLACQVVDLLGLHLPPTPP